MEWFLALKLMGLTQLPLESFGATGVRSSPQKMDCSQGPSPHHPLVRPPLFPFSSFYNMIAFVFDSDATLHCYHHRLHCIRPPLDAPSRKDLAPHHSSSLAS